MNNPSNWSIKLIMNSYAEAKAKNSHDYALLNHIEELYCAAMRAIFTQDIGDLFTVDDFLERIRSGSFIDYDGIGYFATLEGEEKETIHCNAAWLQENRKDYPFIIWYNR